MTELLTVPNARPHPAKYNDALLAVMADMLSTYSPPNKRRLRLLDPFAGTGKVFTLSHWLDADIEAVELEPEWAAHDARIHVGNALDLPWRSNYFDAIVTSPTYGNRMADGLIDKYERITYASRLGRKLTPGNSGAMQWGEHYRNFHVYAWEEATRVLRQRGLFLLNCKNHIRDGVEQQVTQWHVETLQAQGLRVVEWRKVPAPGMRFGQNADKRIDFEYVVKLTKDYAS